MNIFYLTFVRSDVPKMSGVMKKIKGQLKSFDNEFNNCYYSSLVEDGLNIFHFQTERIVKLEKVQYEKHFIKGISNRKSFYNEILTFLNKKNISVLYIRYRTSDPYLIKFLMECKKLGVKIYIEIPTYPYKKEITRTLTKIMDKYYSGKLNNYIENIITFSDHNKIFGVETIKINNAIDFDLIPVKKTSVKQKRINLLGVANVSIWHGYDRVIKGLIEYYNQRSVEKIVTFTIVGEGKELNNLKDMVLQNNLSDYVIFAGFKDGHELNEAYDNADIGIASLGIHRIGLESVSTLKSKEYWSRGLPFIKSYSDKQIDKIISDYVLNIPANDSSVDINEVIEFYTQYIKSNKNNFILRDLAEKNISWNKEFQPVIKAIKKNDLVTESV
ncbi:glycosyltransferase [Ornithinibacillus gellani]|uniref:glycosyltransferase n=1 Tax=Ornithinibacillus gellani TaxID=2293253 RepID=UPI001681ABA2|nr:glycosyltransferase [Ornithinibacillus gellani]